MFKKAFTLIELLVVIAIIGILATIVMINVSGAQKKTRDDTRKADLSAIATALENYRADNKVFPVTITAGDTSFKLISSSLGILVSDGYMQSLPVDPSSPAGDYKYKSDGNQFKLIATQPERLIGVVDVSKAKDYAGDYFDPALNSWTRFQISSSSSAINW